MEEARPLALSVVVPAWNEASRLPATLDRLVAYLEDRGYGWEVIVVSDGSDDGTDDLVTSRGDDRIRLLRQDRRRGKGAAVRAGVLAAGGERILFTDADLATPIEDYASLAAALDGGAEVAIASRRLDDSVITKDQGRIRRTMGRLFPAIVRLTTGLPYTDTQCGFKSFTRDAARRLFEPHRDPGFAFDVEVLARAREEGLRAAEVPVRWESRAGSKLSTVGDPLRMMGAILRLGGRTDLPRVVEHQLKVASGWGAALVVSALLVALLATRTGSVVDVLAVALLPASVFLIGRELEGPTTGALAALFTTVCALYLASAAPPSTALFPAVVVHTVLAAFLVGRRKASWWVLMFVLLGVSLHAGGITTLLLAAVAPAALTVWLGSWNAWRRWETLVGVALFAAIATAVILNAEDLRMALLPVPCADVYGRPHSAVGSSPVILFVAGTLPVWLLGLTGWWRRLDGDGEGRGWRLPLILWSVLPVGVAFTAAWVYPCSVMGAVGGVIVAFSATATSRVCAGRLGGGTAILLLLPALGVLGLAAGCLASNESAAVAAPWILAGLVMVAFALAAAFRIQSVPLVVLVLALTTLIALGAVYVTGMIPLGG